MKLIWHGTASVELILDGGRLLFDPFVPLAHADVPVKRSDFDGFTDVFVTHGHFDHIIDLPDIVRRNPELVIRCTDAPFHTLLRKGVPQRNLRLIRFGDALEVQGFRVRVLHGRHAVLPRLTRKRFARIVRSPARGNLPHLIRGYFGYPEADETVFYEIEADGLRVAHMGSLNLREDVTYPTGADVLLLPYNGWEDNLQPALRVIERLKPGRVLLHHWDNTFPPLTEPIDLAPILAASPVPVAVPGWNACVEL